MTQPPTYYSIINGLTVIDGGYRISETPTHYIDVVKMLFSWRLCETPKSCPLTYDRYWCYVGSNNQGLLAAITAGLAWDGKQNSEPVGWNKNGQTQEWRDPITPAISTSQPR